MAAIPGIKLIYHTGELDNPDDSSLPWRLDANFRPPEFMEFTFIALYGGEERLVVRSDTKEHLEDFVQAHLRSHPRLKNLTITGP